MINAKLDEAEFKTRFKHAVAFYDRSLRSQGGDKKVLMANAVKSAELPYCRNESCFCNMLISYHSRVGNEAETFLHEVWLEYAAECV